MCRDVTYPCLSLCDDGSGCVVPMSVTGSGCVSLVWYPCRPLAQDVCHQVMMAQDVSVCVVPLAKDVCHQVMMAQDVSVCVVPLAKDVCHQVMMAQDVSVCVVPLAEDVCH